MIDEHDDARREAMMVRAGRICLQTYREHYVEGRGLPSATAALLVERLALVLSAYLPAPEARAVAVRWAARFRPAGVAGASYGTGVGHLN